MNEQADPCYKLPLALLLSEDDDGDEALRAMANHIGNCEKCQTRLTALAADDGWWNEARDALSGTDEFACSPGFTESLRAAPNRLKEHAALESHLRDLLLPPSHPELLGRLGRYDVERVIGSGGMGVVLKAHDSELNRPVAIKVLASHLAHAGAARERFAREGRAAAAVVHEHVVAIHNVESDGAVPFLVMQFVPGQSLQSRVDAEGPLSVEQILRIGIQAASGLAAAHAQGLVHRDVKPSNILLEESVERAVLTDFGLARATDDASLTYTGVLAGTPHYMSPEQAAGEVVDHRSDLFSLGAVLYFMATGHPPFRADGALAVLHRICNDRHRPVWQTNPAISDDFSDLIDELLEKNPTRRPANAGDVAERLTKQLSDIQHRGSKRPLRGGQRARRKRILTMVAFVALAAVVGTLAFVFRNGITPSSAVVAEELTSNAAASEAAQSSEPTPEELAMFSAAKDVAVEDSQWLSELNQLNQELSRLEAQQGIAPNSTLKSGD